MHGLTKRNLKETTVEKVSGKFFFHNIAIYKLIFTIANMSNLGMGAFPGPLMSERPFLLSNLTSPTIAPDTSGDAHANPSRSPHSALVIRLPPFSPPTASSYQPQCDTLRYGDGVGSSSPNAGFTPNSGSPTQQPLEEGDFLQQLDPTLRPDGVPDNGNGNVAGNETDASPSKEKRPVPSVANAVYGFVDGVGRGNSGCRESSDYSILAFITDICFRDTTAETT
jgi:hypothetical protein